MADPTLTVISVTFNDLAGLKRTADSLQMQSGVSDGQIEWLVVDGGSSDQTPEWLSTASLVNSFVSEPDNGTYDAMNKGIRSARGEFVQFLNAGDTLTDPYVLKDFLETQKQTGADVVFGSVILTTADGRKMRRPARDPSYIRHGLPGYHQATFYRRDLLDPPGFDLKYRIASDYFLTAYVVGQSTVASIRWDRDVANFELGGASTHQQFRLTIECAQIQRRVLGRSVPAVIGSAFRRQVGNAVNRMFNTPRLASLSQRFAERLQPTRRL